MLSGKKSARWYWRVRLISLFLLVLVASLTIVSTNIFQAHADVALSTTGFVKVDATGTQLELNGQPYRFAGANIYWLGTGVDQQGVDYNTQVSSILQEASQDMSGTVIRAHTLGISAGCGNDTCIEPTLGNIPQSSTAFSRIDYVLSQAQKDGLRVVIPFVDNWDYGPGGINTWISWRGSSNPSDFYTNPTIINDFETYIGAILNHRNSITGVLYKDDPTILAWEEGNELNDAPASWINTIATYIKSQDSNHLVAFGSQMGLQRNNSLGVKNVDIEDAHYYPMNTDQMISDAKTAYKAGKVFYIGEYGWNEGDLPGYLSAIEADSPGQGYLVSGDTYWSLFPNGVDHQDMPNVSFTLHVAADDSAMAQAVAELTAHAKVMSASSVGNVLASSGPTLAATSESTAMPEITQTVPPALSPIPTSEPTMESTIVPTSEPTNGATSSNAPIGKTIWLKSYINKDYVSVQVNKTNAPLAAQGSALSSAEEFDVIDAGNGYIALKAHANGDYVSAWQQDRYTPLEARVNHMESWEWFRWVDLGHNRVALETYGHQDYVSAWQQASRVPLEARVAHMESWETFKWGEV